MGYNTPAAAAARQAAAAAAAAEEEVAVVHEENEWAIEVMPEGAEEAPSDAGTDRDALPEGLHFSMPVCSELSATAAVNCGTAVIGFNPLFPRVDALMLDL